MHKVCKGRKEGVYFSLHPLQPLLVSAWLDVDLQRKLRVQERLSHSPHDRPVHTIVAELREDGKDVCVFLKSLATYI